MKTIWIAAFVFSAVSTSMPARAQATLFSDSFDQNLGQWVTTGLWHFQDESGSCSWNVVPFPSSSGSAAFNSLGNVNCGYFTSTYGDLTLAQPISIPAGAANARLRFMSFEDTECGGANCGWDERFVSVSSDAGVHWTDIAYGATEGAWNERILSLDAYRGFDVLIRFRFDPVDELWNDHHGWLIDDLEVEIDSPFTFYCSGKISSVHCIPTIDAGGDVSLTGPDDLVVSAAELRNNVMSKLIWSRSPNSVPFHGGTLCVAAPAARTQVTSSGGWTSPANCTGTYSYAFTHAYLASKNVLAGETLYVQASTRDPGYVLPWNHSLSAALSFTVLP